MKQTKMLDPVGVHQIFGLGVTQPLQTSCNGRKMHTFDNIWQIYASQGMKQNIRRGYGQTTSFGMRVGRWAKCKSHWAWPTA